MELFHLWRRIETKLVFNFNSRKFMKMRIYWWERNILWLRLWQKPFCGLGLTLFNFVSLWLLCVDHVEEYLNRDTLFPKNTYFTLGSCSWLFLFSNTKITKNYFISSCPRDYKQADADILILFHSLERDWDGEAGERRAPTINHDDQQTWFSSCLSG